MLPQLWQQIACGYLMSCVVLKDTRCSLLYHHEMSSSPPWETLILYLRLVEANAAFYMAFARIRLSSRICQVLTGLENILFFSPPVSTKFAALISLSSIFLSEGEI